ncbi:MAG: hypothetical protein HFJ02_05280 [Bacilli bacterium]|nr:hypothetical protein [Bacilli bacterium]
MALYEEVYLKLEDFPKFYRYEGMNTFQNYDFNRNNVLPSYDSYIYFSGSSKHHFYYVQKKLREIIEKDILCESKYQLKKMVFDLEKFKMLVQKIENYPLDDKQKVIEFTVSPMIKKLFYKNTILNIVKKEHKAYIEKVDTGISGGGGWIMQRLVRSF